MMLDEDEGGKEIPIGIAIKTVCDRHAEMLIGKNEQARNFMLMGAFMDKLNRNVAPKSEAEAEAMMKNLHTIKEPVCCYIGEEAFAKLAARVPVATGNPARDEEIAILMVEGNAERVRNYPDVGEQVPIQEGGTVYLMSLGKLDEDKGKAKAGDLISLISRVLDWETKKLEVLTVDRHKDKKAAHQWFREKMNEKRWLREGNGEPS